MRLKYQTTTDTLDRLHGAIHKLRSDSGKVVVSKDDLLALLHDHAAMSNLVKEET